MRMSVDVIYASHLKPGDVYAGKINPSAPTRPVQPCAAAYCLSGVEAYTDDQGVTWMRLDPGIPGLGNLTPVRAAAQVLVIRRW